MRDEDQQSFPKRWRSRIWWLAIAISAGLFVMLLLQNMEPVEFRVLWTTVAMPRAVMLFTVACGGFALGALWARSRSS